jgi:hypothetical protein
MATKRHAENVGQRKSALNILHTGKPVWNSPLGKPIL